jgi:hypothetical protein
MKIIITERQLNELMSLGNYDAVRFITNNLINELDKLLKLLVDDKGKFIYDDSTEREIIYKVTKVIVNLIIEFYGLEDNEVNRKKINSLFYLDYDRFMKLQLNIKNKKIYFDIIIVDFNHRLIFYSTIGKMVGDLVELLKKKYPKWGEVGDFKKEKILPYKKTPFEGDELSRGIYDWNVTFDTLEKLFYDFLFENLEDTEYEKYKTIIGRNLDKLKEYVGKNNYKPNIAYLREYPNVMISTLEQDKIYDKKYLLKYIESLRDIGIEKKLFDRDFINFLFAFKKFIKG